MHRMSAVPAAIRCLKCLILCFIIRVFRATTVYNRSIREYVFYNKDTENTENTFSPQKIHFHHRGHGEHGELRKRNKSRQHITAMDAIIC